MRPQLLTGTPADLSPRARSIAFNLATPITNGHLAAGGQVFASGGAGAPPQVEQGSAADVQGTGSLTAPHNTPLHVAGIVALAGLTIWGLHYMGFRVAFDVGLGRG